MVASFWYPWNPGDYLKDTMHLTRDQHGGYQLLLHAYYGCGNPLKNDDALLATITKATPSEWQALRPVLEPFFSVSNGVWRHKRADREINAAHDRHTKRQAAGQKGGRPSGVPPDDKHSLPNTKAKLRNNSTRTNIPTDTTITGETGKKDASHEEQIISENALKRFKKFWAVYPARRGKKLEEATTRTFFLSLAASCQSSCVLAAQNYAVSERVLDNFAIKDPKRFLMDDFWKDWVEPEQQMSTASRNAEELKRAKARAKEKNL